MGLFTEKQVKAVIAGQEVTLSTGRLARQANGAVVLQCGDMVLLATAVMSKVPREGIDFFPLMVDFNEKLYAGGRIPGGFFKRETRPSVWATLTARLIDRPLRPSFPEGFYHDVQVVVTTLSHDPTVSMDAFAIVAASAALSVSDIPFNGPVGAVTVGCVSGVLVVNPTPEALAQSTLNIVVAGTQEAILMVEAGASEVPESLILSAIALAHRTIRETIAMQQGLADAVSKPKLAVAAPVPSPLAARVAEVMGDAIVTKMRTGNKQEIDHFLSALESDTVAAVAGDDDVLAKEVKRVFYRIKKDQIRQAIIRQRMRPDGRALDEIRPIEGSVGLLPSVHGSALFTRGETQSLSVVTLGTADDEQIEDGLTESSRKPYYFHYNFPAFSVGEVGMFRTGRRELGHGALAERAIRGILPPAEDFPYTVRIVSEILESNGSSSMASVCAGTLALMDCGVPISAPASGIAMGLLIEGNDYVVLSDIQGLEDHYGDMDFKVAGTEKGITALQLDIKVAGLSEKILEEALAQAKTGRLHILSKMLEVLPNTRGVVAANAPKIEYIMVDPEKVGAIIGPGGKMIRKIEEQSGASVTVSDGTSGQVCVSALNQESLDAAKKMIFALAKNVEPGEVYEGKVIKIMPFGAFVEVLPGKEGLMHISTLTNKRLATVDEVLRVGQVVSVRVREIDQQNRINLVPVTLLDA